MLCAWDWCDQRVGPCLGWSSAPEWWRNKPRTEAHAQGSWSCVPGGSRACQGQAVSWLDHCWAPGSVLSWKLSTHAVILDVKLSGSASMVQCSTVLMQHCCCLGCGFLCRAKDLSQDMMQPQSLLVCLCSCVVPHRHILFSVQIPWSPPVTMNRTGLAITNLRLHGPDKHHLWPWFRTNRLIHTIACRSDACWVEHGTLLLG